MNFNFMRFQWSRTWRNLGSFDSKYHRKLAKVKITHRKRFSEGRMFTEPRRVNIHPQLLPKYLLRQRRWDQGPNKRRKARHVREEYYTLRARLIARRKVGMYGETLRLISGVRPLY